MTVAAPGAAVGWGLLLVLGVPALAYLRLAVRWGRRRGRAWSAWRSTSWLAGLLVLGLGLAPPMAAAAHLDPRAHMLQHLLVGMYAPAALVLGAPVRLLLGATTVRVGRAVTRVLRSRVVHVVTHPAVATVLSAGGLWVLYATRLYAVTTVSPVVHHLVLVHLVASGGLFAWAVAGTDPGPWRPGLPVRLGALLVSAASHAVLAKTLYARAGEWPPGAHGTLEHLREAAVLMYYGGDAAELLLATAVLAGWYAGSRPRSGVPAGGRQAV